MVNQQYTTSENLVQIFLLILPLTCLQTSSIVKLAMFAWLLELDVAPT